LLVDQLCKVFVAIFSMKAVHEIEFPDLARA